jgi:hypothetical protein
MTRADLHQFVDALPDEAVEGTGLLLERSIRGEIDPAAAEITVIPGGLAPVGTCEVRSSLAMRRGGGMSSPGGRTARRRLR